MAAASNRPARRPGVRRVAGASLAAVAVLTLSACNGDSNSAADPVESASPPAGSTASASPSASPSAEGSSPAASASVATGDKAGVEDFLAAFKTALDQATTAHLSLVTSGGPAELSAAGSGDFTSSPPQLQMSVQSAANGAPSDVRLIGGVMYLKLPQLGDKFLTLDLTNPNNPFGATFGDNLDLGKLFDTFSKALLTADDEGTEKVDGDQLDHWSLTVDTKTFLAASLTPALASAAATQLPATIPYDVYFDSQGYYRKVVAHLGSTGTTTIDYDDWGTKVDIVEPPASQTTAFPTR